jgi:hypothetical protein
LRPTPRLFGVVLISTVAAIFMLVILLLLSRVDNLARALAFDHSQTSGEVMSSQRRLSGQIAGLAGAGNRPFVSWSCVPHGKLSYNCAAALTGWSGIVTWKVDGATVVTGLNVVIQVKDHFSHKVEVVVQNSSGTYSCGSQMI